MYNYAKTIDDLSEDIKLSFIATKKIREVAAVEMLNSKIHILKLLRHPNIVQLFEIIEDNDKLFLFIEYAARGELFDYIVKNQRLKEKEACKFFQHILNGVDYIHKLNVVHRDLKPENLLLDENKNIKIVDFGLSNT
jgi:5'-AMP-activated protein kinase catalytic alpha subunit